MIKFKLLIDNIFIVKVLIEMYVSKIRVKNFKTFNDVCLDLNKFNVLIGACGSGKTNFIQVFELLNDISYNFHEAIKKHGGSYVKNFNLLENNLESCIEVKLSDIDKSINAGSNKDIMLLFNHIDYEICFNFYQNECKVQNELVKLSCNVKHANNQKIDENEIIIKNNDGEMTVEFLNDLDDLEISEIIPDTLVDIVSQNFKKVNSPIINSALATIPIEWGNLFKNISDYDFDPKFCKNLNNFNNNEELTKYGENLLFVLKNILNDETKKKEFLIYYTNMLPYIKDVSVEKILDEERIFMIVEKYNDVKIPAPFISDGSSTLMAILIALYFQDNEILLIEEPERHIHPSLINQLILMMESVDKQVIITTHSPELLKYSELEDILFIYRENDGFSRIDRVIDNDVVKAFIDELGVDSVFVNDYLGLR